MSIQFRSFGLSALFAISSAFAQQPLDPPLKNWTAPLYWSPSASEKKIAPRTQSASPFSPPGAMTFFAMTPCRVMDTRAGRGFTGAFGPPSLSGGSARDIPMLSSPCNSGIPSTVGAYSINVAVVPPGPLGYLTVWPEGLSWPGTSTLNATLGEIVANAAIVAAGTNGDIQILASNPTDVIIDINGYYASPTDFFNNTALGTGALAANNTSNGATAVGWDALHNNTTGFWDTGVGSNALLNNTSGNYNTALGTQALALNTTGGLNTAVGSEALTLNTTGDYNVAVGGSALSSSTIATQNTGVGASALAFNTTGSQNTALGYSSLLDNTIGSNNVAVGAFANLNNTTGSENTAVGASALQANTNGVANVALGLGALTPITTGSSNIGIGLAAGNNLSGSANNNIDIGSWGTATDIGAIRLGTPGNQTSFFVAGVNAVTTGNNDAVPVLIDSNGQLGTISSSRRYKEDIHDMGDASRDLMRLRPVTFRYKKPFADGSKPIQYGLIAEEVAEVYPDLVVRNADGQVETVKYQLLDPLLLNELERQQRQIDALEEQVRALTEHLAKTESANSERR